MANYLILHGCVQGVPNFLTLVGSTIPALATSITDRQDGVYHYQGATVADTLLGDSNAITRLLSFGAIQAA